MIDFCKLSAESDLGEHEGNSSLPSLFFKKSIFKADYWKKILMIDFWLGWLVQLALNEWKFSLKLEHRPLEHIFRLQIQMFPPRKFRLIRVFTLFESLTKFLLVFLTLNWEVLLQNADSISWLGLSEPEYPWIVPSTSSRVHLRGYKESIIKMAFVSFCHKTPQLFIRSPSTTKTRLFLSYKLFQKISYKLLNDF